MVDLCNSVAIFLLNRTSTPAEKMDKLTLVSLTVIGSTCFGDGTGVDERSGVAVAAKVVNKDEKKLPVLGFALAVEGRSFLSEPEEYTHCITLA